MWHRSFPALRFPLCFYVSLVYASSLLGDAGQDAAQILKQTGVTGGFIVHLGVGSGELTAALRQGEGIQVQGLDRDVEVVQRAREHIRSMGVYGDVAVDVLDGSQLPYIDNLVNLMVIEDASGIAEEEVL